MQKESAPHTECSHIWIAGALTMNGGALIATGATTTVLVNGATSATAP